MQLTREVVVVTNVSFLQCSLNFTEGLMRYSTSSPASPPQVTSTGALIHSTKVSIFLKKKKQ